MVATNTILHQAGVIAYRILDGKVQVLLMTSRDTSRWIIPKGNIDAGATPAKAAEREAYEEAGVKGTITSLLPLGIYTYFKKLESGEARAATVEVYLLRVKERLKKWPEKGERKLSWVSTKEAVRLIEQRSGQAHRRARSGPAAPEADGIRRRFSDSRTQTIQTRSHRPRLMRLDAPLVGGEPITDISAAMQRIANFWPYATTLFDYTRRAMP